MGLSIERIIGEILSHWSETHRAMRGSVMLLLVLVALDVVGFSSPYWTTTNVFDPENEALKNVQIGLWKYCFCETSDCTCMDIGKELLELKEWFKWTQGCEAAGLALMAFASILALMSVTVTHNPTVRMAAITFATFGGFLVITGATIFALNVKQNLRWPLYLCTVSGFLTFVLQVVYGYGAWTRLDSTVATRYRGTLDGDRWIVRMNPQRLKQAMKREGLFQT